MGKKHASQYANFGWLRVIYTIGKIILVYTTKLAIFILFKLK